MTPKKIFNWLSYVMIGLVILEVICFTGIFFLPYNNGNHYWAGEFSLIVAFSLMIPIAIVGILMMLIWTWWVFKGNAHKKPK